MRRMKPDQDSPLGAFLPTLIVSLIIISAVLQSQSGVLLSF